MRSSQATYRAWAEEVDGLPLFFQPWWLDAVSGPRGWAAALVRAPNGHIAGALPYCRFRKGIDYISNPPLTPHLGPYIVYPEGQKRASRYGHAKQVLTALLDDLPTPPLTYIKAHPDLEYTLPFHWAGFRASLRYTYRIAAGQSEAAAYENLKGSVRTELRQAAGEFDIRKGGGAEALFPLVRAVFRRQGLKVPFSEALTARLHRAAAGRGQGEIWLADDAAGRPRAGLMVVRDDQTAYLLMTGRHPEGPPGALTRLVWAAVGDALGRGLAFDFEGSMLPGVEHYFRSFGGQLTPYPRFFRAAGKLWELLAVAAGKT